MNSWVNTGVPSHVLEHALGRVEDALLAGNDADALLARREADRARADDDATAVALCDEILTGQTEDGSWGGSLIATAAVLLRLADLAGASPSARVAEAAGRGVAWLKRLRGRPGRYGEGCDPARHRAGLCHHFLGGFFAPEPPLEADAELQLPNGSRVPGGAAAQLTASCLALRATMRWGARGPDALLHLDGLRRLLELDTRTTQPRVPLDALPAIALVLLEGADRPEFRAAASHALERIVQVQRADGSWPELDTFAILEVLIAAVDSGFDSDAVDAALVRGSGLLALSQRPDGHWERDINTRRTRIGWRTLRHTVRSAQVTHPDQGAD